MNKIESHIAEIDERVAAIDADSRTRLEDTLRDLPFDELVAYQNIKSEAQAAGILTVDEALTVYGILNDWSTASLAGRITVTKMMEELLAAKLGKHGAIDTVPR